VTGDRHVADLGEYSNPTDKTVSEMISDDCIGYPSEYDYDSASEFIESVKHILECEVSPEREEFCSTCEQYGMDSSYSDELHVEEYSPEEAPVEEEKKKDMQERGIHLYRVRLRTYCEEHEEDWIDYSEDILATPGALNFND